MKTEDILAYIACSLACIAILILFITLIAFLGEIPCKIKANQQELEYKYSLIGGSYIKQNNKWIDYEKYRYMGD